MVEYRIRSNKRLRNLYELQRRKFSGWSTEATFPSLAGCVQHLRKLKEQEVQDIVDDWAENA